MSITSGKRAAGPVALCVELGEMAAIETKQQRGGEMWWWIGIGGFILFMLYMLLFLSVGLRTIGNGHSWMFVIGIFFPVFWLIGALMREYA